MWVGVAPRLIVPPGNRKGEKLKNRGKERIAV
jgi:hypothetical protein